MPSTRVDDGVMVLVADVFVKSLEVTTFDVLAVVIDSMAVTVSTTVVFAVNVVGALSIIMLASLLILSTVFAEISGRDV